MSATNIRRMAVVQMKPEANASVGCINQRRGTLFVALGLKIPLYTWSTF